jgi:transposase
MLPSPGNIRILKGFIDKNPLEMDSALVQMPSILANKCKESISNVEMSVTTLSEMLPSLYSLYEKLARRGASDRNEALITQLRTGITELTQLIVTFDEFLSVKRRAQAS